jgi:hypothetical protein
MFNKFSKKYMEVLSPMSIFPIRKTDSQEAATQSPEIEICSHLPAMLELMESMVEDENRLSMYESEVETIHQLGMSFQEWRQLSPPPTAKRNGTGLIYITVS